MATLSKSAKFAMGVQIFLLRRGWMGKMDDFVMIITTTGRKSGKKFTTPIAYQRDGENIIAVNPGNSNWLHNVASSGEAILEIKRQVIPVTGSVVKDDRERQRIFDLYRQNPSTFERLFKVSANAPETDLQQAMAKWQFVRFNPK
ncbi:MAG: nitroreductase family deazaflavin-dependent oxidoreductase [Anaerolineae bacterium]|nr:nitroreductase family deazaflavin-dependent oxidoreductase [Anaerolineae bacterium]